ncbi:MAG: DUF4920 domain-containing protein [Ginsengibacter sp.]
MKKILLYVCLCFTAHSFAQVAPAVKGSVYGSSVNNQEAISVADLQEKLESEKQFTGKVTGKVVSVCQEKGCWMKLAQADGSDIMIRFKDYKFFVPKNIEGKEVVLNGVGKKTTTSVAMLKHYAKDAGKTDEEIDKITEPKDEIVFTAAGVLVL